MPTTQLSVYFFLQMAVILAACQLVGLPGAALGQPQVVGEMIAGVLLGPVAVRPASSPSSSKRSFPKETRACSTSARSSASGSTCSWSASSSEPITSSQRLQQRGVGVASRASSCRSSWRFALTPWLLDVPGLFSPGAEPLEATLFLGAAIAITAFPMLARIIHERGLAGTSLGTLALSAGAIDDAAAWCVLAIVLASFGGGPAVARARDRRRHRSTRVFMLFVGPRLLAPLGAHRRARRAQLSRRPCSRIVLMLFCLSACIDGRHRHPRGVRRLPARRRACRAACSPRSCAKQLEPFTVVFLLPMFFTYSGLNTQLDTGEHAVSCSRIALGDPRWPPSCGKFVACWAAARLSGEDNRDALGIGALMNARGLMELIIINIGLQAGIIGPALFSMLVLMAIVTTLMASPLFDWVTRARGASGAGAGAPV